MPPASPRDGEHADIGNNKKEAVFCPEQVGVRLTKVTPGCEIRLTQRGAAVSARDKHIAQR